MNVTRLALHQNRTTLVIFAAIMLAGIMAFIKMPRAYDPGFVVRTAQVVTHFPGASPDRVEKLVTDKIETVIQEMPELDFIKSESRTGVSIILVNIKETYKDMRPIWDSLRRKVDRAADDLPQGVLRPIVNDEFGDIFGSILTLSGNGFSYSELEQYADRIKDELLRISDIAKVEIYGEQAERVFIEFDNARLTELNISPAQLTQSLSSRNVVAAGGAIVIGDERLELEPTGNFESLREIEETLIRVPGSDQVFYLGDLASVTRGITDPADPKVRTNGQSALALAISMREGGNNIALGDAVKSLMPRLVQALPLGLELSIANFSPDEVEEKVSDFTSSLLQSMLVVLGVMFVALGFRTGLVIGTIIPASMIAAILVMSFFNIGLDQISLASLIIALGMLVDNGIVMSENILVKLQAGKARTEAAIESATELCWPLLVSSLTTAAAFLPIFLAESKTGEFTASLFKVVTITLLCSWIIAITIIPLLCVKFLKVAPVVKSAPSYYRTYRVFLQNLLNYRYTTLIATVAVFGMAMFAFKSVPKQFFPPSDRSTFKVELELPAGSDVSATERVVAEYESALASDQAVSSWVAYIGNGGPRFALQHTPKPRTNHYALMVITAMQASDIQPIMSRLEQYTLNAQPNVTLKMKRIETGPSVENPVEIRLSGVDAAELQRIMVELKSHMSTLPSLKNISDDWGQQIKKLVIDVDQARALRSGISSEDIALSLKTGLSGLQLTEYREDSASIPVMMRSNADDRQDIGKLEALSVFVQKSGKSIPLRQVADIRVVWEPAVILRRDRSKTVTVGAQLSDGYSSTDALAALTPWLQARSIGWEMGYRYAFGGECESSAQANASIAAKLPVAGFIIVILLVAQFNSIRKTIIILATIPLGLIGVSIGLNAVGSYFGFMTLLGIISLTGIVINNAIVLLESIKQCIDERGFSVEEAVLHASEQRLRPILLTTATTVLGLLPLYLGGGAMWEPMAISIIAGLLFSTVLTLGVVPVLYATLYPVRQDNIKNRELEFAL